MSRRLVLFALLAALGAPAIAQETAPVPRPRPDPVAAGTGTETPLPRPRPDDEAPAGADDPPSTEVIAEPSPAGSAADEKLEDAPPEVAEEPPAEPVPPRIYQTACPAVLMGQVEAKMLPPIEEAGGCGERSPLAVSGLLVNGRIVPLSGEMTMNCQMASQLPGWASSIDGWLEARENTGLARVIVGTSYACRPRNNVAGADVSEHGFANALDVVGFELEDGRTITLPDAWSDPLSSAGRLMRHAHDAACGVFTTTLGPEANALHHDHLHVDLGCHGQRCTARLCE